MNPIPDRPIAERIAWLFDLARRHGEAFRSPDAWLARQRYLAEHPTAIAVMKCMDGRINIPVATRMPAGIVMPFRNLGGMFDLGWPHLGEVVAHHVERMVGDGRRILFLITYHWSRGNPRRGCAGFGYDTAAAIVHTQQIRQQMEHIFGHGHATVYPLVCGFETDEESLTLHGNDGASLDLSTLGADDQPTLEPRLAALLAGNLAHIADIRAQIARRERQLDIEHREWTICIGRGFDFLHTPNQALIIGPYSPNLAEPVRKAAGIIKSNMQAGRIPADGFLLFASVPYDEIGVDRARAELKARFLSRFAADVIAEDFPELAACMTQRTAVLDWHARQLELLAA
ncbi:MAG: hypothetical protein HXL68_08755 [Dechloromonas agitata]|uniref:Carboxysome shell carbonic anhydrase n=1 Tax=Dechloromonas agitata TaxID=73030 RepID=A0A930BUP7_9RHOO|nr:hypothetical protein [Dechloromonas agitata]